MIITGSLQTLLSAADLVEWAPISKLWNVKVLCLRMNTSFLWGSTMIYSSRSRIKTSCTQKLHYKLILLVVCRALESIICTNWTQSYIDEWDNGVILGNLFTSKPYDRKKTTECCLKKRITFLFVSFINGNEIRIRSLIWSSDRWRIFINIHDI